jgi:hypothetical protein
MSLVVKLAPNGHDLMWETDHGLPVRLDQSQLHAELRRLLRKQAESRANARVGLDANGLSLVLAEWQRSGPPEAGGGKIHTATGLASPLEVSRHPRTDVEVTRIPERTRARAKFLTSAEPLV